MVAQNPFRILLVDDDPAILKMISLGLQQEGFQVKTAEDGEKALKIIPDYNPHVVVLDVMMPGLDGYELCQAIPRISEASMIMLTAKNTSSDVVKGLRQGAHDYIRKPFHFDELLARIEVQLRLRYPDLTHQINVGPFSLDDYHHLIQFNHSPLELSPTEYKLLSYLLANPSRVLSKTLILDHVWGFDFSGDENIVEVYIRYLRDKLGDKNHKIIETVRGAGYRLVCQQ